MSTKTLSEILENNKGPYAAMAVLISTTVAVLQLPADQINRLKDTWPVLIMPASIVLLGYVFSAYIAEQKTRTTVENGIYHELTKLGSRIDQILCNHLDDKMSLDREFDTFRDRLAGIDEAIVMTQKLIEKRKEYTHGDTEKFSTKHPPP